MSEQSCEKNLSLGLSLLPIELQIEVLKALPNISSLRSLAFTCSSLYRTYSENASSIIVNILSNELGTEIISEVNATLLSSQLPPPRSIAAVREFLAEYNPHSETVAGESLFPNPAAWTLSEALVVSDLHTHVQYFADDFCSSILTRNPISGLPDPSHAPLSKAEKTRIYRVFYRVELYCNLFRIFGPRVNQRSVDARLAAEEQQEVFFDKFTPWENEQLGCIHDYLLRKLSTAFNDVAQHDVLWGEFMIEDDDHYIVANQWKQGFLSKGLAFLHQAAVAQSYEDRAALLCPNLKGDQGFLQAGLLEHEAGSDAPEHGYNPTVFPSDVEDSGAYDAWRWGLEPEDITKRYYYQYENIDLREWGYCMWDLSRLQAWGFFDKPWKSYRAERDWVERQETSEQADARMKKSWDARSRIYQRSGSGWWAEGDESKIVWKEYYGPTTIPGPNITASWPARNPSYNPKDGLQSYH